MNHVVPTHELCMRVSSVQFRMSIGRIFYTSYPANSTSDKKKLLSLHDLLSRTVSSGDLKFMEYIKRKL